MILVDGRVGSRELLQPIRRLGVQAELAKLEADFQWEGSGEDGPVLVGVERKAVPDLAASMRDGRLAGRQIGMMLQSYDICYLVVEGIWRRQRDTGLVEEKNGGWHAVRGSVRYSEVTRFLSSLTELAGVRVWRTADEEETAAWLVEQWHWWQKGWHEHRTDKTIYSPEPGKKRQKGHKVRSFRTQTTLLERWLYALPHIEGRVEELAPLFSSALDLATAEVDRWRTIKGVGKKTSKDIVEAIHGIHPDLGTERRV